MIVGRALGWNVLKSSRFEISRAGSNFIFRGSGFGHGLGLCQEGAHVMASRGASYRQILMKYFPGTRITKEDVVRWSADIFWQNEIQFAPAAAGTFQGSRRTLSGEQVRVSYPSSIEHREAEALLNEAQSHRRSLNARLNAAGVWAQLPSVDIFVNETTGDFVGRTGQPPWSAGASKGNRIELQPLAVLKRRKVLSTTLRHEFVHVVIEAIGSGRTPRWLSEGLAIHFAGEGPLVSRYAGQEISTEQVEQKLAAAKSPEEMKTAYAAAYSAVRRMINAEGESNVWRRVSR
jgi:stage II sporulation protein D